MATRALPGVRDGHGCAEGLTDQVIDREIRDGEVGVGQAEPERERGGVAVALEQALPEPLVVGDGRGVTVEEGEMGLGRRNGEGQPSGCVDVPEQHIGESMTTLGPGVPTEQDGGDGVPPFLGDDGAGRDDRHDGAGVGRGDRTDDLGIDRTEP